MTNTYLTMIYNDCDIMIQTLITENFFLRHKFQGHLNGSISSITGLCYNNIKTFDKIYKLRKFKM